MAQAAPDEQAFVARVLAILTNPEPTGIAPDDPYGQADDGIDRWNGFGREVWVESLEVVDGAYGPELEVTVGLAVPAEEAARIPGRAVTGVPFEREWRRLSGYESRRGTRPMRHARPSRLRRHTSNATARRPQNRRRPNPHAADCRPETCSGAA